MKTGLLAAAMWLGILGYFALYHGIAMVTKVETNVTSGSGGPDPIAHLAQQDYIK